MKRERKKEREVGREGSGERGGGERKRGRQTESETERECKICKMLKDAHGSLRSKVLARINIT